MVGFAISLTTREVVFMNAAGAGSYQRLGSTGELRRLDRGAFLGGRLYNGAGGVMSEQKIGTGGGYSVRLEIELRLVPAPETVQ